MNNTPNTHCTMQWHSLHECHGVSNHRQLYYLFNSLFRMIAKKPKLHYWPFVTGIHWLLLVPLTKDHWCGKCFHVMTSSWIDPWWPCVFVLQPGGLTPEQQQEWMMKMLFPGMPRRPRDSKDKQFICPEPGCSKAFYYTSHLNRHKKLQGHGNTT